jgi:hypothetical protein
MDRVQKPSDSECYIFKIFVGILLMEYWSLTVSATKFRSYLTGNTLRLRYELNRLMLSIGLWRRYINITITILDIVHRLVFYLKLNSIDLSIPHRKHVTSPLRAQQVNAIYRFVTMEYYYNYHNSEHYPSSCLVFKTQLNSIGLCVPHRKHITSPLATSRLMMFRETVAVYC